MSDRPTNAGYGFKGLTEQNKLKQQTKYKCENWAPGAIIDYSIDIVNHISGVL